MSKSIDVYVCVVAGVATKQGKMKVRFARDIMRVKGLVKDGQENVQLVELPQPMSKGNAVKHLLTLSEFTSNSTVLEALENADIKYNGAKTVKVSGVNVKVSTKAKTTAKSKAVSKAAFDAAFVVAE
jgi:hypothetical protein